MTYLVEADGMTVPECVTADAQSHEDAAARVALTSYPGRLITVDRIGGGLDRRWFEVVSEPAPGVRPLTVSEIHKTAANNVVRLPMRHTTDMRHAKP